MVIFNELKLSVNINCTKYLLELVNNKYNCNIENIVLFFYFYMFLQCVPTHMTRSQNEQDVSLIKDI